MPRFAPWLAGWRPYALLVALCLGLYLPGIAAIPVLDRDEARFAQATRQMLETGDFIDIRFQDEARNQKPAGIYWLQAAAVHALSDPASTAIWPYRLPSLVGAGLAVLLTFGFGRALLRGDGESEDAAPAAALLAAVLLATALGVVAEAHIAKTDACLLAAITCGQGALGLAYVRSRAARPVGAGVVAAFWAAQIAAILLKGPLGPVLALLTAATVSVADRDARWLRALRPVAGSLAAVLVVGPWLYAIERATEGRFLSASVGHDLVWKLLGAQESHGAPPFYYVALALLTFWPGSLFLAPTLIRAWRSHERPAARFLLAWIVPAWVSLEMVPTKLPHYVLPLYPALALLAATAVTAGAADEEGGWLRWAKPAAAALWLGVTLLIAGALIVLPLRFGEGLSAAGIAGAVMLVALAVALLRRRPAPLATAGMIAALALTLVVPAGFWVMPALDRLWLSRGAAAMVAASPPVGRTPLVVLGYNEPSLVFLLGGRLQIGVMPGAVTALTGGGEALVSGREDAQFQQGLAARGLAASAVDSIRGTDYSNGQRMVLTLYKIAPK